MIEYILDDEKLIKRIVSVEGGNRFILAESVVLTKDMFIAMYDRWIINTEDMEDEDGYQET